MRVLMQRPQQIEVLGESFVVLAGRVGAVAMFDMARALLPRPPVVAVVAAFDLMRRRGRTPKKALGKSAGDHGCCATIANTKPRIISARSSTSTALIGPTTAATARSVDIA